MFLMNARVCVQRNKDSKRKGLPNTLIFLLSTKEMNENLRLLPFLWARKMRITFLVTYTHEVMTDKLNGWGHTRPVQTLPLPPTVRLDTLGDFQGTLQIKVEVVKITTVQHPREGSQDKRKAACKPLRAGWRSAEEDEGLRWHCQVLGYLPVQVGTAAKRAWVRLQKTEDWGITRKCLLGSNSRFIHTDVMQR